LLATPSFKRHKLSYLITIVTILIVISLFLAPAFSISTNTCNSCHGNSYNQQLDLVEGSGQNVFPTNVMVGQTATVTVVVQNINNVPRYTALYSVSITLSSQNNHFSVKNPTYTIGVLQTGVATATWQITGTSQGSDILVISASAINTHESVSFADRYLPGPSINVLTNPNLTSTPTPSPTPISSPTTEPTPTVQPTLPPGSTATPNPTNHSPPSSSPTGVPSQQPTSNPTLAPTATALPTAQPTNQNSTDSTPATHSLDSSMLFIHPPLAIIGYAFSFLFAALLLREDYLNRAFTKNLGRALWVFTLLGLVTGMIWAQIAWGSYWSWDSKEILTLMLFLTVTAGQLLFIQKKYTAAKWIAVLACVYVIVTALSSFILAGLHSYL
jgi:hypothetical protein